MSFHRWWLPLAAAAVLGALAWIGRMSPNRRLNRISVAVIARVGWVGGLAMLLVAALTQTPWVPHETIETPAAPSAGTS